MILQSVQCCIRACLRISFRHLYAHLTGHTDDRNAFSNTLFIKILADILPSNDSSHSKNQTHTPFSRKPPSILHTLCPRSCRCQPCLTVERKPFPAICTEHKRHLRFRDKGLVVAQLRQTLLLVLIGNIENGIILSFNYYIPLDISSQTFIASNTALRNPRSYHILKLSRMLSCLKHHLRASKDCLRRKLVCLRSRHTSGNRRIRHCFDQHEYICR